MDAHRKRQQAAHPDLTMTGMYNVLEKLRSFEALSITSATEFAAAATNGTFAATDDAGSTTSGNNLTAGAALQMTKATPVAFQTAPVPKKTAPGAAQATPVPKKMAPDRPQTIPVGSQTTPVISQIALDPSQPAPVAQLTRKEREIHEKGLVSVLKQIHEDLNAAVGDAYGWPHDLDDEEILQRLVDLNHERAAEEARGLIRWLRPDFQDPDGTTETQQELIEGATGVSPVKAAKHGQDARGTQQIKKQPWPASLPERVKAMRATLSDHGEPATSAEIAKYFTRARPTTLDEILETLVAVGQARQTNDGRFVA